MDLLNTNTINSNNNNNNNKNTIIQHQNHQNIFDSSNINVEKFHEFFKNEEISIGFTLQRLSDGSINSIFYMSNFLNKNLTNIKINFMVQKFVTLKVLLTSGNNLGPMEFKGIKKEINVINSDNEKKVIIKLKYTYTCDGNEVINKNFFYFFFYFF